MPTLAALVLLLVAAPLAAQEVSADSATPPAQGYAPGGPPPPTPAVSERPSADPSVVARAITLPLQSESQIQEAMSAAETDLRRAQARLATANENRARLKAMAEQQRARLREIEVRRKQAEKEKRKTDQSVLEAEKRAGERQQRWAEEVQSVGDAELDAARQACLVAFAKHQALDRELQLAQMRNHPRADEGSRMVRGELERQTLEAQLKYRKLAHELARKEEDVADKRIQLYKAALP
ncbi:MAG TPA: hypothetical protein VGN76_01555 [Gemmatimonadales bacterium]|nr:hypothetical protein [Gemmatimonadales bacterium]